MSLGGGSKKGREVYSRISPSCQQPGRDRLELLAIGAQGLPVVRNDCLEVGKGMIEGVVHDDVIELAPVGHVGDCVPQPTGDDFVTIGAATAQPLLECGARGREDKD